MNRLVTVCIDHLSRHVVENQPSDFSRDIIWYTRMPITWKQAGNIKKKWFKCSWKYSIARKNRQSEQEIKIVAFVHREISSLQSALVVWRMKWPEQVFLFACRDTKIWSTNGVEGVYRFLARAWRLVVGSPSSVGSYAEGTVATEEEPSREQLRALHQCILKVDCINWSDSLVQYSFNIHWSMPLLCFDIVAGNWRDWRHALQYSNCGNDGVY